MYLSFLALLKDVLIPVKNNLPVIIMFLYTSASLETLFTPRRKINKFSIWIANYMKEDKQHFSV